MTALVSVRFGIGSGLPRPPLRQLQSYGDANHAERILLAAELVGNVLFLVFGFAIDGFGVIVENEFLWLGVPHQS